jgi:hypothetical protein
MAIQKSDKKEEQKTAEQPMFYKTKPSAMSLSHVNPASLDRRMMMYDGELMPDGMDFSRWQRLLKYYYDDTRWLWRDEQEYWHLILNGKEVAVSYHILCYDSQRYSWEDRSKQVHLVHGGTEVVVADSVRSYSMRRFAYLRDNLWTLVHDRKVVATGMDVQSYALDRWFFVDEAGNPHFHGIGEHPTPLETINNLNE